MVGNEVSLTNAVCQILTVGMCHYVLAWLRYRSSRIAQLLDGVPLFLLEQNKWRSDTLSHMRIQDDDVMDMARDQGLRDLSEVKTAVLETYGEISVIPVKKDGK